MGRTTTRNRPCKCGRCGSVTIRALSRNGMCVLLKCGDCGHQYRSSGRAAQRLTDLLEEREAGH